jgi:hypothetical protein
VTQGANRAAQRCQSAVTSKVLPILLLIVPLYYLGLGGGFGFGTPVVSYAPLPMLQTEDDCGISIIVVDSRALLKRGQHNSDVRQPVLYTVGRERSGGI